MINLNDYRLKLIEGTSVTPSSGVNLSLSDEGTIRGQNFYPEPVFEINAVYGIFTHTEKVEFVTEIIDSLGETVFWDLLNDSYSATIRNFTTTAVRRSGGLYWTVTILMWGKIIDTTT